MKKIHDIEELKNFYKTNHRLPNSKKETGLYVWITKERNKENKEVIEFLNSIGYKVKKQAYTISDLIDFYKSNSRLPGKKDGNFNDWMNRERKKGNKEVIEFLNSIGYKVKKHAYTISDLIDFYKSNNRLPNIKEESFYTWMIYKIRKGNKEVIEFTDSVGYKVKEKHKNYTISDLIDFYKSNSRLPSCIKESRLYAWMNKERNKGNEKDFNEVKTFLELIDCKDKSVEAKEILESILVNN